MGSFQHPPIIRSASAAINALNEDIILPFDARLAKLLSVETMQNDKRQIGIKQCPEALGRSVGLLRVISQQRSATQSYAREIECWLRDVT